MNKTEDVILLLGVNFHGKEIWWFRLEKPKVWNKFLTEKHIWAEEMHEENLWVSWTYSHHLKGRSWSTDTPGPDCYMYCKKICRLKDEAIHTMGSPSILSAANSIKPADIYQNETTLFFIVFMLKQGSLP